MPVQRSSIKWLRRLIGPAFIFYSAAVIYWMFIGFGREIHTGGILKYNLVPLRTVLLFLNLDNGVALTDRIINLIGNIVVFIPFGFMLPLIRNRLYSLTRLTLYAIFIILILEMMQMLLHVGSFDVDDLLLNMVGVWAGYRILRFSKMNSEV
ncbi:VanZ family protein [Paenibacillus wynnii]|uniref:VanZ family protein n=1 Tax=Paenibacillus wynnii TaxID=268407 RepID=UPI0012FA5A62|nr:VanZ family protein [Paenibacillus wynnii]